MWGSGSVPPGSGPSTICSVPRRLRSRRGLHRGRSLIQHARPAPTSRLHPNSTESTVAPFLQLPRAAAPSAPRRPAAPCGPRAPGLIVAGREESRACVRGWQPLYVEDEVSVSFQRRRARPPIPSDAPYPRHCVCARRRHHGPARRPRHPLDLRPHPVSQYPTAAVPRNPLCRTGTAMPVLFSPP